MTIVRVSQGQHYSAQPGKHRQQEGDAPGSWRYLSALTDQERGDQAVRSLSSEVATPRTRGGAPVLQLLRAYPAILRFPAAYLSINVRQQPHGTVYRKAPRLDRPLQLLPGLHQPGVGTIRKDMSSEWGNSIRFGPSFKHHR